MKLRMWASIACLLAGCGDSGLDDGSGGGGTQPAEGVCQFTIGGDTNDIVKERGEFYFDGSTLKGNCMRDFTNGTEIVADLELKAYQGPGQSVTIDESEAWGSVGFDGNDGFRYSIIFDPPAGRPPAKCTVTVDEGPTEAKANERISVTFDCPNIYGLDYSGTSTDTHEVAVTEGHWEATTFQ
ncbi:MAG TPA: hypothetical protein VL400_22960 [Polyangiaceae bacterium]|nr:hypothetical protein [Polyangiaceae bacterium]